MTSSAKDKLRKRLGSYWKLELANIVFVPAIMIWLSLSLDYSLSWRSFFAMVPMCGLLCVGGLYWRAKYLSLDQGTLPLDRVLPGISRLKYPLLITSIIALGLTILAWIKPSHSGSLGDRWTMTVAAGLAGLEYINYYHRQLQHFDHIADLKRLLDGKGFRRSQMAKDLMTWKRKRV